MKTLFVTDLDGTFLNHNQEVDFESKQIINTLVGQGIHFTIATARSWESVQPIVRDLELRLPIILINGVFTYDIAQRRYLKSNFVSPQLGERILTSYLADGLNPLVYTIDQEGNAKIYYRGIFNKSEENYIGNRLEKGDQRFRLIDEYTDYMHENIITINAIDTPERLQQSCERFQKHNECFCHLGPDIYTVGYSWLEITNRMATKKEAVLELKQLFKYEKVVCFGDNLNDLSMFEAADEKYAVSNAHPEVLKRADRIIGSNQEHGVAKFLWAERKDFNKGNNHGCQ